MEVDPSHGNTDQGELAAMWTLCMALTLNSSESMDDGFHPIRTLFDSRSKASYAHEL